MFLECIHTLSHIIKCILHFIENNSVLVGIITSMIVGSLWLKKFINQKRAEAFFGFYARLSLCLKALRAKLEENGRLNISQPNVGNIYSLIYAKEYIADACPGFTPISSKELESYKAATTELKKILLETENNVYPLRAERKEWYESQHIVYDFCEFIENEAYQYTTNEQFAKNEVEPKHIAKCKLLIQAINYIQESIDRANY